MGHVLTTDEGLNPDPKKVEALTKMQTPKDKKSLQEWLSLVIGLITYLGKFLKKCICNDSSD